MNGLRRIDRAVVAMLAGVSLASLGLLFVTVAIVVVTRIFSLRSAGWTDELIELFFAWLLFPCIAWLWRSREHFTVDLLLVSMTHSGTRRALLIVVEILSLVFLAIYFWQACVMVESSYTETSPVFGLSRIYWYGVMPLTALIMIAYSVAHLVSLIRSPGVGPGIPSAVQAATNPGSAL